ncbi:hypothetical protein ACKVMT_14225 [Halobacteriales archaeon Cl-PHB]
MTTIPSTERADARSVQRPTIVKNAASSYFTAVDLAEGETLARLGDGRYPHTAVFHPNGRVAYLLYISSAHVEVIDLDRLETIQRVDDLGRAPVGSALGPDAEHFFLGTGGPLFEGEPPGLIALSLDDEGLVTGQSRRTLGRSAGMRVGPDDRLYVAQSRDAEVAVLSADADLEEQTRLPVGDKPHDMYVLGDDLLAVNNAYESYVSFLDIREETVRCEAEVGENPHGFGVAEHEDYRYALVPAREADDFAVVDLDAVDAGEESPTEALIDVGTSTGFVDATPDGRWAITDSYDEEFVTILDLEELAVAGRVEVPGEPLHVVFGPDAERGYVGNMDRPEIAVLDIAPLADDRPGDVTLDRYVDGLGEKPSGIFPPEGFA